MIFSRKKHHIMAEMTLIVTSLAFLCLSSENRTNIWILFAKKPIKLEVLHIGFRWLRPKNFTPRFFPPERCSRVLSDVACCTATCYNTLARTANEANPYRHTAEQTPLPSLPSWEPLELPVSALTLKDSMVERPQGILRHWQSCRLLLTKEGS